MLPSILAHDVTEGLKNFIITGFETPTPFFQGIFSNFVEEPGNLYKGPYLSLSLPFISGTVGKDYFSGFETQFPPHSHQQSAFDRLKSDSNPKSTLIATGTGSGKTECFLYPILDHCQNDKSKGIKAIIIYPMNALANDQAKRFAEIIHSNESLNGNIRVGLFVGEGEHTPKKVMTDSTVITDKETLRANPPDILLTNYKMLDYLLMRPKDRPLWNDNKPETLRYLVVDELHTFDGAQGTDLACLLRRLKSRLDMPENHLVCIGTSATLGSDEEKNNLIGYAKQIFNSDFDDDSIISERRKSISEFLNRSLIRYQFLPPQDILDILEPENYKSLEQYLIAQYELFFPEEDPASPQDKIWRQKLGAQLKEHLLFHNLLRLLEKQPRNISEIAQEIEKTLPKRFEIGIGVSILNSLCALISNARDPSESELPLVQLRLQLWLRELRRMVSRVVSDSNEAKLTFADDVKHTNGELYLPLVQCNECHSIGWLTMKPKEKSQINTDLRSIYSSFFGYSPETVMLFPLKEIEVEPDTKGYNLNLCTTCGHLQKDNDVCLNCHENNLVDVFMPDNRRQTTQGGVNLSVSDANCPICSSKDCMIVFGSRVATLLSVAIQHSYSSLYNDDKKLIAFSDSVQDAAHRAGFFAARTWQNNVRQAIAQALVSMNDNLMPLEDFYRFLPSYWSDLTFNSNAFDINRYVSEFIAPNMEYYQDYDNLKISGSLPKDSTLINDINKRLEWEILAEIGYRSKLGRSLERVGVATVGFYREKIDAAITKIIPILQEEIGSLRDLNQVELEYFVFGLLLHLKKIGSIYHRYLDAYIANDGRTYLLNYQSYLPKFSPFANSPKFLISGNRHSKFETITKSKGRTWCQDWCNKVLGVNRLLEIDIIPVIYKTVLDELVEHDVLIVLPVRNEKVWAINPEALYITSQITSFSTQNRRSFINVPTEMIELLDGMPSIESFDIDIYRKKEDIHWLKRYYQHGVIQRVIAEEHTGILDGVTREQVEANFKSRNKPWHPNLLSATPTLEMGIDIGNLSSVMLCSIPPGQTNYLQRIGRAGRRDGNAFNLAVASGNPHDLYFYSDPMLMMAGQIEPPGVYLNASAVIARQLTAFCIDKWVASGIDISAIPHLMRPVLDNVQNGDLKSFPYTLIEFVTNNVSELLQQFIELFDKDLTDKSKDYLKDFLLGNNKDIDGIEKKIINRLFELVKERQSIKARIDALKRLIDRLESGPQDEAVKDQIKNAQIERGGLQAVLRSINSKETLNFFTDEGLIPNYAFPEEGVVLRSVIYSRRAEQQEGEGKFKNDVYEYERPGVAAISELAPENNFYAGGRKVQIKQVNLNLSEIEEWRFCSNCSKAQNLAHGDDHSACPNCGDIMWADSKQRQKMIRLRQVMANTSDKESRISDDSDDREPTFYTRQMLADFSKDDVEVAYRIAGDDLPFGFEFIKKSTFREMNFGERADGPETITIAGKEAWRPGFKLCKYCGTVQRKRSNVQEHAFICKTPNKESDDNILDCLYLYREFTSEAVRILLPITSIVESDRMVNSFIAAVQLGLKKKFGGKVDHLRMMVYEEPIINSAIKKQFLMLYDSVPGGTGYLHVLMLTPDNLLDALRLSRDCMVACECNKEVDTDGCYKCLYAYRNSYGMESTSRDTAVSLLSEILDAEDKIEKIDTSISDISVNPTFESELEKRFINAICLYKNSDIKLQIQPQIVNGKPGYFINVKGHNVKGHSYTIEPQEEIIKSEAVAYPSRPDFLIRSVRQLSQFKPVAVFVDGLKYHKEIVTDDTLKRLSIVQSGNYFQWTLTWQDINTHIDGKSNDAINYFSEYANNDMRDFQNTLLDKLNVNELSRIHLKNSLEQMIMYLAYPDVNQWRNAIFPLCFTWFNQNSMTTTENRVEYKNVFESLASSGLLQSWSSSIEDKAVGGFEWNNEHSEVKLLCDLPLSAINTLSADQLAVIGVFNVDIDNLDEVFRPKWAGFWHLYNLIQFFPMTQFSTQGGINNGSYESIHFNYANTSFSENTSTHDSESIDEDLKYVSPKIHQELISLISSIDKLPIVGFELQDNEGEIIATAEVAWPNEKIALLVGEQVGYLNIFTDSDWTAINTELNEDWVNKIKSMLMETENAG